MIGFIDSEAPFVVVGSSQLVQGWAPGRLPFEPKGWMRDYRQALRRAVENLDPREGSVLRGHYQALDKRTCDVENVLLYNVGVSAFSRIAITDVSLRRSFQAAPPPPRSVGGGMVHYHRYELDRAFDAAAPHGSAVIAEWTEVPLELPVSVERVWHSIRSAGRCVNRSLGDSPYIRVDVSVHRPADAARPAQLGMVKALVDGALSAFHAHDGSELVEVSHRLGHALEVDPDHIADRLIDDTAAALGARRLLWPYRKFVQWNPADDRIVALHVSSERSRAWYTSGRLSSFDGPAP